MTDSPSPGGPQRHSHDGRRLASSGMDGVRIWDLSTDAELLTLPLQSDGAWHVAFSPDGKSLAAAGGDGFVTLWKTEPVANP